MQKLLTHGTIFWDISTTPGDWFTVDTICNIWHGIALVIPHAINLGFYWPCMCMWMAMCFYWIGPVKFMIYFGIWHIQLDFVRCKNKVGLTYLWKCPLGSSIIAAWFALIDFHQQQLYHANFIGWHIIISLPVSLYNVFVQWFLCICFQCPFVDLCHLYTSCLVFLLVKIKRILSPQSKVMVIPEEKRKT